MDHTEKFIEMLEKALDLKFYDYQKEILRGKNVSMPSRRCSGKTLISMLVQLTKYDRINEPIELAPLNFVNARYFRWYASELRGLRASLLEKGIPCREIVLKRFG